MIPALHTTVRAHGLSASVMECTCDRTHATAHACGGRCATTETFPSTCFSFRPSWGTGLTIRALHGAYHGVCRLRCGHSAVPALHTTVCVRGLSVIATNCARDRTHVAVCARGGGCATTETFSSTCYLVCTVGGLHYCTRPFVRVDLTGRRQARTALRGGRPGGVTLSSVGLRLNGLKSSDASDSRACIG